MQLLEDSQEAIKTHPQLPEVMYDNYTAQDNHELEKQSFCDEFEPMELNGMEEQQDFPLIDENRELEYRFLRQIGQGAFGTVSEAVVIATGQQVAIKRVYQSPNNLNREIKIVTELQHRNVIKSHSHFFARGKENPEDIYLYIIMDYIPMTLHRMIRSFSKRGDIVPAILIKLFSYQLFRALAYIRGLKVMHRDIKPSNILIDMKDYRLVLCDFGSSKKFAPGEESVAYICSRDYRAPELVLGMNKYDFAIDMWSAGCVLAEMVLGYSLFLGNNNKEHFLRIVNLLGPPTDSDLLAMQYPHMLTFPPEFRPIGLRNKLGSQADPELLDLLSKVFTFDPTKRIKPLQALYHPFFDELRKHQIFINQRPISLELFDFTPEEVGSDKHLLSKLVPEWYQSSTK